MQHEISRKFVKSHGSLDRCHHRRDPSEHVVDTAAIQPPVGLPGLMWVSFPPFLDDACVDVALKH